MGLATNGAWNGSYTNSDIDGEDVWDAILNNTTSPHHELVFHSRKYTGTDTKVHQGQLHESSSSQDSESYTIESSLQYDMVKYVYNLALQQTDDPLIRFNHDLNPNSSHMVCSNPSLIDYGSLDDDYSLYSDTEVDPVHIATNDSMFVNKLTDMLFTYTYTDKDSSFIVITSAGVMSVLILTLYLSYLSTKQEENNGLEMSTLSVDI